MRDLPTAVEAGIETLVDASLLQVTAVLEESRFTMLETIREFAGELLVASGEVEELRQAHAETYLVIGRDRGSRRFRE